MASNYRQPFVRQEYVAVSSAIPSVSLTLTSLPRRPVATAIAQPLERLETNHFLCGFAKDLPLYQYDVVVEEFYSRSNKWLEVKGRSRCSLIVQSLINNNALPPTIPVWYDEQKCLYSTSLIPTPQTITSQDGHHRLNIKDLVHQWSTNEIYEYINGRAERFPSDAMRILETLLKKSLQDRVQVVNNTCYFLSDPPHVLPGGLIERFGFVQALNLAANRITLNIQTKLTTFYPDISLIDFIHQQIGRKQTFNDDDYKKLNRVLKSCLVVTQQSDWRQAYEIDRFDHRRPDQIFIESGENLIAYYKNSKNISLIHTNYPCVQVFIPSEYQKPCHLPLEVCWIKAWQIYDKPLSKMQEGQQPQKRIPRPDQRHQAIMQTIAKCDYNSPNNRLCRQVGFAIQDREMLKLEARIISQPQIHTGPNSRANIRIGRIPLDGHLFTPKQLSALAITYFGYDNHGEAPVMERFCNTLLPMMREYHVDVRLEKHVVQPTIDEITRYFQAMNAKRCEFVLAVMSGRNEDDLKQLKANIKDCGTMKYGIMTQCALLWKIADNHSLRSYCENLLRKINHKNSGINTKVNLDIALKNKKSRTDSYMFFGADVIHPTNVTRQHPSIAAVVGSGDSLCSTTAVRVCQQYPKEGKCSIETILGLTDMTQQLLDYYRLANKVLPNKIVFYRDGVDDGQFAKIIAHEIPLIRNAFNHIYGDRSKHPLLTFIVVKKRHNTRFFLVNQLKKQIDNLSIGAVIDTTIVHPYQHNFFLNSHRAFQGVNHASLYHVLLDEIGFTADELETLTYHLCFTDPRSSASEAIPSVVHQADIAALKARDLFYDDGRSSATSVGQRSRPLVNPQLDDLDYQILEVHQTLKNRPIFS